MKTVLFAFPCPDEAEKRKGINRDNRGSSPDPFVVSFVTEKHNSTDNCRRTHESTHTSLRTHDHMHPSTSYKDLHAHTITRTHVESTRKQ